MLREGWDPVKAAVATVHRGVILPTLMACSDLPGMVRFLQDAWFYRMVVDQARFKLPENYQAGRVGSSEDRAKARLRGFYAPFEQYVIRRAVALNTRGGEVGARLPVAVMDDLLRLSGLHLGVQERNRLLGRVERAPVSVEGEWYERLKCAGPLEPGLARDGALFSFLGALTPVVAQRFQTVAGSLLWYGELMLPPSEMRHFLIQLEEEIAAWLEARAVLWEEIPRGQEGEYALLELSALGGVPMPIPWSGQLEPWARLVCGTVGGDVSVLMGNVDLAASVMQRTAIDAAYERYLLDREPGELTYPFIGRRYGVRSPNTITKWRKETALEEDDGSSRVNGGFAGAAAVQVMAILAAQRPGLMSKGRLLAEMRERCKGPLADPDIVDMALRQLLREDRVQWVRHGKDDLFGLRDNYVVMSAERLKHMSALMEEYLRSVPGLARAVMEDGPGTHVFCERRWIRRAELDGYVEAVRLIRDRIREEHSRKYHEIPEEEWVTYGLEKCQAFLLSRVTPVSPR